MDFKACSKCGTVKSVSLFRPGKNYCRACAVANTKRWRADNKPDAKPRKPRKISVPYSDTNAYSREYRRLPEVRAKINARAKTRRLEDETYRLKNIARVGAHRALKLSRSVFDTELSAFAYEESVVLARLRSSTTKLKWDVDHIVPLQGKTVSGLHVWANFAVVPASVNRSKGNKFWPDMP